MHKGMQVKTPKGARFSARGQHDDGGEHPDDEVAGVIVTEPVCMAIQAA